MSNSISSSAGNRFAYAIVANGTAAVINFSGRRLPSSSANKFALMRFFKELQRIGGVIASKAKHGVVVLELTWCHLVDDVRRLQQADDNLFTISFAPQRSSDKAAFPWRDLPWLSEK